MFIRVCHTPKEKGSSKQEQSVPTITMKTLSKTKQFRTASKERGGNAGVLLRGGKKNNKNINKTANQTAAGREMSSAGTSHQEEILVLELEPGPMSSTD